MDTVGLSMALGAFLGGVLLADSEYRHTLELDIEPFKGLLLGLFFIAVGMSVDLGLFVRSPALVFLLAFSIIALKIAILFPIARTFGYCGRSDAALIAIALSQVGEFAFVLFGAAGRILPRETLDLLNAAVAASMLSTPFLLMLYERVLAPRFGNKAYYGDATRLDMLVARRVVARFRRHDEELLADQAPHRNEVKHLIAVTQRGRHDIERLLAEEAMRRS
jgi:glutathione-regulated potassium-efflux system ancillary protein KefC